MVHLSTEPKRKHTYGRAREKETGDRHILASFAAFSAFFPGGGRGVAKAGEEKMRRRRKEETSISSLPLWRRRHKNTRGARRRRRRKVALTRSYEDDDDVRQGSLLSGRPDPSLCHSLLLLLLLLLDPFSTTFSLPLCEATTHSLSHFPPFSSLSPLSPTVGAGKEATLAPLAIAPASVRHPRHLTRGSRT